MHRQDINTVARRELAMALSHNGTAKEAAASLMARCKQNPDLYRQLMDRYGHSTLRDACVNAIKHTKQQ
jgi:hypothetical protein